MSREEALGELVTFRTGKLNSNAAVPDGAYPFFTCAQETYRTNTYAFDTKCVLLAGNNANGIYPIKYFAGKFDAYQRTYVIESMDERRLLTRYLFYALQLQLEHLRSISTGAATKFLTLTLLKSINLKLPSLSTQQRIASILSTYDDLIENNTRRISLLEEMARRIYEEWFVRFRFPGPESVRVRSQSVSVPDGWRQTELNTLAKSIEDGDWIETKDQGGEDFRLLQISNVGVNRFVETGNYRFISQETFKRLRCREIMPGQLLIARMPTPIGRTWLVTPKPWRMVTAVDVAIVEADVSKTSAEFLLHFLNSDATLAAFATQASGTTRRRIARRQIAAMPLLAPPPVLAHRFSEIVRPMNDLAEMHARRNETLRAMRDLLLPKLISGELDVSEISEPEALAA